MSTKPKKFLGRHEADKRALRLYAALEKIKKMPRVGVDVRDGTEPIVIWDVDDVRCYEKFSVDFILRIDIDKAIEAGGTLQDLIWTRKASPRPQPPQTEIDRAVEAFMTGNEEEVPPE